MESPPQTVGMPVNPPKKEGLKQVNFKMLKGFFFPQSVGKGDVPFVSSVEAS